MVELVFFFTAASTEKGLHKVSRMNFERFEWDSAQREILDCKRNQYVHLLVKCGLAE